MVPPLRLLLLEVSPSHARPYLTSSSSSKLLSKCSHRFMDPATSALFRLVLALIPCICLSLQISGRQFALRPQFCDQSKKTHRLSVGKNDSSFYSPFPIQLHSRATAHWARVGISHPTFSSVRLLCYSRIWTIHLFSILLE